MKTVFLICEFNPFHAGHQYLMDTVRKSHPGCLLICLMSGNFVERGSPASADRWMRTEMALRGGADAVLELPYLFAVQGAARFARGAVRIADAFGADYLAFGAETDHPDLLMEAARATLEETADFSAVIAAQAARGRNAGAAREAALAALYPGLEEAVRTPNNILGVEYLRSLLALSSSVRPLIVRRRPGWAAHHIRRQLAEQQDAGIREQILQKAGVPVSYMPVSMDDTLYRAAACRLRMMDPEKLSQYAEISDAAAARMLRAASAAPDLSSFLESARTRWLTKSRLRRALLHLLTGVRKETVCRVFQPDSPLHTRLLGLAKNRTADFGAKKKSTGLTVVSSFAQYPPTDLAKFDIRAAELYHCLKSPPEAAGPDQVHRVILL